MSRDGVDQDGSADIGGGRRGGIERETGPEESSLVSLVVDIQHRGSSSDGTSTTRPSIDILTRLRGSCVSVSQQTGQDSIERHSASVCGSLAVNFRESTGSITLGNPPGSRTEPSRSEPPRRVPPDRPPPSYTSVGVTADPVTGPWSHPLPPPSYEQAVGIRYLDREVPFISVGDTTNIWGYRSQPAYCVRCNAMVITQTVAQRAYVTHLSALLSFLCLCWPCMVFPYFLPIFQEVHHRCPACNSYLGFYRPLGLRQGHHQRGPGLR